MTTPWLCGLCLLISMTVSVIHGRKAYVHIRNTDIQNCSALSERVEVELRLGHETLVLKLEKNPDVDENAPLFLLKTNTQGQDVVTRESSLDIEGVAVYIDVTNGAAVEVSCSDGNNRHVHLTLYGTFSLSDGNLYSLRRVQRPKRNVGEEDSDEDDDDDDDVYDVEKVETSNLNFPDVDNIQEDTSSDGGRRRRSVPGSTSQNDTVDVDKTAFNIDVLAYVNYAMYQRWYAASDETSTYLRRREAIRETKRVIAYIFNGMNLLYKTAKPRFNVRLVGYVIEDESEREWLLSVKREELRNSYYGSLNSYWFPSTLDKYGLNADKLMGKFLNWSKEVSSIPKNDHIMVFVNQSLYMYNWLTLGKKQLLGIAYVSQVCRFKGKSVSLIKYTGDLTESHIVCAHELGHSLGAQHDATKNPCTEGAYVMHNGYMPKDRPGDHRFSFSTCSQGYFRKYVQDLLRNDSIRGDLFSTNCLTAKLPVDDDVPSVGTTLPGQHYDPNKQCQMMKGERSYFLHAEGNYAPRNVCQALPCRDPESVKLHFVLSAADGTSCGDKRWCINAKCVYSPDAPSHNDQCVFGNSALIRYPRELTTCERAISSRTAYYCYALRHVCCETCLPYANSEDKDCMWGDNHEKMPWCDARNCHTLVNGTHYYDICCKTCAEYRKTVTTQSTTTTTTVTTTTADIWGRLPTEPWTPWSPDLWSSWSADSTTPRSDHRGHYRLVRVHNKNGAAKAQGITSVTLTSAIISVLLLVVTF